MIELNQGSVEEIIVDVDDLIGSLTTLDAASPTFTVIKDDDSLFTPISDEGATNQDMRAFCLVDTSILDVGQYKLYLTFQSLPEVPILGPVMFRVNAAIPVIT